MYGTLKHCSSRVGWDNYASTVGNMLLKASLQVLACAEPSR